MGRKKMPGSPAKKAKRALRRIKMLKPFYKNRKRLAHMIKSVGRVVEKRL
ncbi:MAG: hypothetical protein Q4D16_02465 [Eubacteriales bacterium]|nr:hypothetical protein [Eubacteriales bacterium]